MKRILVTVDFSNHTEVSSDYALNLAMANKAELTLFHTYKNNYYFSSPSMPDAFEISPVSTNEMITESEELAKNQMDELKNKLLSKANEQNTLIDIKTHITNGDFKDDLFSFCDEYTPTLVIVGSKGSGDSSFLFGSTTIRIFNTLKFPVIAVPSISKPFKLNNILYVADIDASNKVLIKKTFDLFKIYQPKVYCVHVTEDNNFLKAFSSKEFLISHFAKEIEDNIFKCDVFEDEDKQDEIDRFIENNDIDLIAFMPHKANFFQRLFGQVKSKNYLFETNLPILAVRI